MRIRVVPVEEYDLRLVQRNGHFSKTDGSGFDQSDIEVREPCDVLRGRRGHSDTNPGRPY